MTAKSRYLQVLHRLLAAKLKKKSIAVALLGIGNFSGQLFQKAYPCDCFLTAAERILPLRKWWVFYSFHIRVGVSIVTPCCLNLWTFYKYVVLDFIVISVLHWTKIQCKLPYCWKLHQPWHSNFVELEWKKWKHPSTFLWSLWMCETCLSK